MSMTRHNFFLPDELVKETKEYAKKRGVTMAEIIRQALDAYLNEQKCKTTPQS